MAAPRLSTLLVDAPVDRHFAELHDNEESLSRSVGLFVATGLRRGNGVVLVSATRNTERYLQRLEQGGIDTRQALRSGQLIQRNAESVLARVMHGSMPDWPSFRRVVGSMLEEVQQFGRSATRAYGEMVNVLWRGGCAEAAIRLEEYWNELARVHPFALFCGYMLDSRHYDLYRQPLHEIGRTHSDISVTAGDERFRDALDQACKDVYGVPLATLVGKSGLEDRPGESRLPDGQRTMLWIMRHMPETSAQVLKRARGYYQGEHDGHA